MEAENPPKVHDVVMIGAGPAALAAAIYTTREAIETVLYERGAIGGLAAITDQIDNYPGFAHGVSGLTLAGELQAQAERFGALIKLGEVSNVIDEGGYKRIATTDGEVRARAVLIATGTDYKKLGIPGEREFFGRGVHYCATCDGAYYRGKQLVVIGGGNSALQEALFLTRYATRIDLLVRSTIRASDILQRALYKNSKITVHLGVTPEAIIGEDNKVVKVVGRKANQPADFTTDGVFVFVGLRPNTEFLRQVKGIELDEAGFIKTSSNLQTGIPGIFACGDVRSGATMQIASAVGEGATAALKIRGYLERDV